MKRVLAAAILMLGLAYGQTATERNGSRIVLPNPKLLRCKSSDCYQVFEKSAETNAVFPKQVTIDMNQSCLYGMTALFDKFIPLDDIKAAIDERYGKWAVPEFVNSPLTIWRVEPEKFATQLSVASKKDEKRNMADASYIPSRWRKVRLQYPVKLMVHGLNVDGQAVCKVMVRLTGRQPACLKI
jgi:hypothetical protein